MNSGAMHNEHQPDLRAKTARIEVRSTEQQKQLLEQAAAVYGESLTGFVLSAAIERAIEIIRDATITEVSLRDMERFAEILDQPSEPNEHLTAAAAKYHKRVKSDR